MPTFSEVREKYPQYKDLSDQQLAEGLHKKFYSDLPFEEFSAKVGYKAPEPFPDVYSGTGGYNPMLAKLGAASQTATAKLGLTPENTDNQLLNAAGPAEAALQAGTGMLALPFAGLTGLIAKDRTGKRSMADIIRDTQEAMTYQPRGGVGQGFSKVASAPGEAYSAGTTYLGEKTADVLGPAAGATVKTLGDIAPAMIGARGAALERPAPRRIGEYVSTKLDVPNTVELRAAKNAAYKAADDAGVVIKPESTQRAISIFKNVAESENLGKLPPDMAEAVKILSDRLDEGKPLSLKDADKVRQKINDAAQSQNAADRRLSALVKSDYDKYLDNLNAGDVLSGNSEAGLAILKKARELHGRLKRSEMLDEMDTLASLKAESNYTQSGHEHALRKQYESLTSRAIKGDEYLTPEQLAAVRRVAAPGISANMLRNISKLDPARGGMSQGLNTIVGGGLGGALGSAIGGPAGAGAGAIAGTAVLGVGANLASRAALRGTLGRVGGAREALVGRGMPSASQPAIGVPTPRFAATTGPLGATAARSPAAIRADIAALEKQAESVPIEQLRKEFERLQAELDAAQSAPGVLGR